MSLYTYRARLGRIVDGDTLDLDVDLGFRTWRLGDRFRLAGVNAPEARTPEGEAAAAAVEVWFGDLTDHGLAYVQTSRDRQEKFGRYLAWVYAGPDWPEWAPRNQAEADTLAQSRGGTCLNVALVLGGHATWYWGGARSR